MSDESKSTEERLYKHGQEEAMMIVVKAATMGTSWTTGSGLEGPSVPKAFSDQGEPAPSTWPPLLSKSPRRSQAIKFTCNKCGHRTMRAINPHAYKEGTVFVQVGSFTM